MTEDLERKINRAREILFTSRHAAMATVNADGSPHNTPFRLFYDPKLENIYWGSHPDSLHSLNVVRTGKIFVVVYDRIDRGGLYIKAENAHLLEGKEIEKALNITNEFRIKEGSEPLELGYYTGESPQRLWGARVTNLYINNPDKKDGLLIKDGRKEISANDILE